MNIHRAWFSGILVILLVGPSGCLVGSLSPWVDPKEATFDQSLLGVWQTAGDRKGVRVERAEFWMEGVKVEGYHIHPISCDQPTNPVEGLLKAMTGLGIPQAPAVPTNPMAAMGALAAGALASATQATATMTQAIPGLGADPIPVMQLFSHIQAMRPLAALMVELGGQKYIMLFTAPDPNAPKGVPPTTATLYYLFGLKREGNKLTLLGFDPKAFGEMMANPETAPKVICLSDKGVGSLSEAENPCEGNVPVLVEGRDKLEKLLALARANPASFMEASQFVQESQLRCQ